MGAWTPDSDAESNDGTEGPVALAGTAAPIPIRVVPMEDDRIPEGMVGLATYVGDNLVARCVVPPEVANAFAEHGTFSEPVRVVLAAREGSPGLQCQLFALAPMPPIPDEDEPWASSVPGSGYEAAAADADGGPDEAQTVAIPLGQIVRFQKDRKHPDDLALETVDVLSKIVAGRVVEVVDKALEDLFGS